MTAEQSRTVFKAATIVSIMLVVSRLFGYVREMLLAARFGATYTTDAYYVAYDLPFSLFSAVGAALVMVFLPVYRSVSQKRGEQAAWGLVNTVLNLTLLVAVVLLGLGVALAPYFVPALVPRLPADAKALAISLTRQMLPMILFMGLTGVASAVLNANRRFTVASLVGLVNNVPVVLVLLVVTGTQHINWVAWAVVSGAAVGALILVPALPTLGFKYRLTLDWKDPALIQVGRLLPPVLLTTSVLQFQDFVDRFLASGLAEGSISALNYAIRVNSLPYGVVGASIATVLYPSLAEHGASGQIDDLRRTVTNGLRSLAFVLLPMVVGVLVFTEPIVELFLERGAFGPQETVATAYALGFYALGILFFGWQDFLNRCFFALQDTMTPMWASVVLVALSVFFKITLVTPLAHGGLALGAVLATLFSVAFLLWKLRRRLGRMGGTELLRSLAVSLGSSLAGAAAGYGAYMLIGWFFPGETFLYQALRLGPALGLIVIVHVGLAVLLGNKEGAEIATRLLRRLARPKA